MMINKVSRDDRIMNKLLSTFFSKKVQLAFELDYFGKYRNFKDGIDFVNSRFEYNNRGDHTPRIHIFIGILNYKLVEFGIYNTYHEDWADGDDVEEDILPEKFEL